MSEPLPQLSSKDINPTRRLIPKLLQ